MQPFKQDQIGSLLILSILLFSGCAAFAPDRQQQRTAAPQQRSPEVHATPSTTATANEESKSRVSLSRRLLDQDTKLAKENQELKTRIGMLEERLNTLEKAHAQELQNMNQTLRLMELNIKDFEDKLNRLNTLPSLSASTPAIPLPSPTGAVRNPPTQKGAPPSDWKELETPKNSQAIEEYDLMGSGLTAEKLAAKRSRDAAKMPTPIPIENDLAEEEVATDTEKDRSHSTPPENIEPPKPVAPADVAGWEDPDLNPPKSPIVLEVYPGAKVLYRDAFKAFTQRNYEASIEQFREFLKRYPNDQDADNSQFWIGHAYFQMKDYAQAEEAYRRVLRYYAHGDTKLGYKTPDAILMLGRIYLAKKLPIRARSYFENLTRRFPSTRSADKARRELESMKGF